MLRDNVQELNLYGITTTYQLEKPWAEFLKCNEITESEILSVKTIIQSSKSIYKY